METPSPPSLVCKFQINGKCLWGQREALFLFSALKSLPFSVSLFHSCPVADPCCYGDRERPRSRKSLYFSFPPFHFLVAFHPLSLPNCLEGFFFS